MSGPKRLKMRIYLDTGAVIEFRCREFTKTVSNLTGQLTGYEFEGALGNVPRWISIDRIVAVTREVKS